ncbi:hypothetical protein RHCRD62_20172 [Rhodococcus sp. RD6.2]|nr:hypothetical protein RHCRD62_20172 [Rhodococcus sp. RD6.2]
MTNPAPSHSRLYQRPLMCGGRWSGRSGRRLLRRAAAGFFGERPTKRDPRTVLGVLERCTRDTKLF